MMLARLVIPAAAAEDQLFQIQYVTQKFFFIDKYLKFE